MGATMPPPALAVALLVGVGAMAPVEPSPPDPGRAGAAGRDPAPRLGRVVVAAEGLDPVRLEQALAVRLRGRTVTLMPRGEAAAARPRGEGATIVALEGPDPLFVRVTTPDGLRYERAVAPDGADEPERLAAMTVAHLLLGIEQGRETPVAASDAPKPPKPGLTPPAATPTLAAPKPRARSSGPAPSWVGLAVSGGTVLAPGRPAGGDVFAAAGGGLALRLLRPDGLSARLGLRLAGRDVGPGAGVLRIRTDVGLGAVTRVRDVVLAAAGLVYAEPVVPLVAGRVAPATRGGERRRPWLVGGAVRLAASWVFEGAGRRVRVGPYAELGAGLSFAGGRAHVPSFEHAGSRARVRAGGFEIASGIEVTAEWAFRRRRSRRSPVRAHR